MYCSNKLRAVRYGLSSRYWYIIVRVYVMKNACMYMYIHTYIQTDTKILLLLFR
jgi:hypothetical protein